MPIIPRPAFRSFVLAAALSSLFSGHVFSANDKKAEQAEARALLAKSRDLSNIELAGSPAFVLNAKIHYQIGTQTAEGDGQIIWTAPDHYRVAYSAPNYFYNEIVRDGYRYLARTHDEMPLVIYELHTTAAKAMQAGPNPKDKIDNVAVVQSGNDSLTCITFKPPIAMRDCLDSNGDMVTAESGPPTAASPLYKRYEFSDFVAFGAKRFPQKIVFHGGDGYAIEIDVRQLALIKELSGDAFTIPSDAMKEPWCAEPKTEGADSPTEPFSLAKDLTPMIGASRSLAAENASLYFVIGPNGHVRAVTVIHSSKPIKNKDLQGWVKNMRFPSLRCGKDGIEYQIEIGLGR